MGSSLEDDLAEIDLSKIINPYLSDPVKGMALIGKLLSQEGLDENDRLLKEIKYCLEKEFVALVATDAMPDEGVQIMNFYHAYEQLTEALRFPVLESKHVFAIGGGFSSGKSSFVNALLGKDILPTDTRPTTSIPTLICRDEEEVRGVVNMFDKHVSLDDEALQAICHVFNTEYKLGFAGLLKHVLVTSPRFPYPFAAFLDTPGYSKSDKGAGGELSDRMLAQKQIEGADYVIWLIDIHHGTIPQTDIAFIKALGNNSEVFFVLTKADQKNKDDIESIFNVTRKDIEAAGLRCAGLISFSSHDKNDFSLNALDKFVRSRSKVPRDCGIRKKFSAIFESYEAYYSQSMQEGLERLQVLRAVSLLSEAGLCPSLNDANQRLMKGQINSVIKSNNITNELLPRFNQLRDKVIKLVDRALCCIEKARKDAVDTLDHAELYSMHVEVHAEKDEKKENGENEPKSFLIDAALKGNEAALKELMMYLLHKDMFGWDPQSNSYLIRELKAMKTKDELPAIITRSSLETMLELAGDENFFGSNQGEKE